MTSPKRTVTGGRAVTYYGPLRGAVARQFLAQRCRVHDTPDSYAYCDPEWQIFDPTAHSYMTFKPDLLDLVDDLLACRERSVEDLAAAVRGSLSAVDRRRLAELLRD